MELIKAYSDDNAVKVIAFAINFTQKLSNDNIDSLIKKLNTIEYFKNEFSEIQNQEEFSMTIGQDGLSKHTQSIGGVVCNKVDQDKSLTWSLTINKEFIIITCRAYTRWKQISLRALEYIDEAFKIISYTQNISQITLEYLDEFEVLNPKIEWKESLFKKDCGYIPSNIYNHNDFWHINQGYFIKLKTLEQKLLDTININYFADGQDNLKHKVNIRTQHKLLFGSEYSYKKEYIKNNFEKMHVHSKEVFEKIVDDKILEQFKRGEVS